MRLSAVIITYNEARNIGRCLDSLAGVADEVVVLDSFSTDATESICRGKGARFEQHPFDTFFAQKNRAIGLASHDLVLSLDADEALSEPLRQSVLSAKGDFPYDAWEMSRLTNYCGQWIRHSGWYPDRKVRLFDRRKARWAPVHPHEYVAVAPGSTVGRLEGDLLHYSYYTVEEHRTRSLKYAEMAAQTWYEKGKTVSWLKVMASPVFKFIRNYLLKRGFLDGRAGWTICRIAAWETYWKYRTLRRLRS